MKRTIRLFALAVTLAAAFVAPVMAQTGANDCDANKATWYADFLKYRNDPQQLKLAYDAAKKYLTNCPEVPEDQIGPYLKKWVAAYEKGSKKTQFEEAFIKKDYSTVASIGREMLVEDASNVRVAMLVGYSGFLAAGNNPMTPESAEVAKKAIEMIEAGKAPESWVPFTGKDQGLAWLNYSIGKAKLKAAPAEALPYLIKAARFESELKKDPNTYLAIVEAYESGPFTKQSDDYKRLYGGKDETPESKLALENINQIVDRMIDASARAAALTNGTNKQALMEAVAEMYKGRHSNSAPTEVNELVAGILNKPLPDVPTPLTSLPTPTPTPTTPVASGAPAPATNAGAGATTTKTGTNNTAQPQNTNAKPAQSTTPAKPKPRARANHRRRG